MHLSIFAFCTQLLLIPNTFFSLYALDPCKQYFQVCNVYSFSLFAVLYTMFSCLQCFPVYNVFLYTMFSFIQCFHVYNVFLYAMFSCIQCLTAQVLPDIQPGVNGAKKIHLWLICYNKQDQCYKLTSFWLVRDSQTILYC